MGVNLPAHLVVLKGTVRWVGDSEVLPGGQPAGYQEYSQTEVRTRVRKLCAVRWWGVRGELGREAGSRGCSGTDPAAANMCSSHHQHCSNLTLSTVPHCALAGAADGWPCWAASV